MDLEKMLNRVRNEIEWRKGRKVKVLGGINTDDMEGLVSNLETMIAVNKKLLSAVSAIADESSPFDKTGEPLQVRVAKDLTRRIEIAKSAL